MTERRDFDKSAATWDEKPRRIKLAEDVTMAIRKAVPLSPEWDALDFGCGTGLLTMGLAPHLASILGVDTSAAMVEQLCVKAAAVPELSVSAVQCDLEHGELPDGRFHLIVSSMVLHHIPDPLALLVSLRRLLHPGGWLAFADLEAEDGSFHDDPVGVFHHGFSRQYLESLLLQAGCIMPDISTAARVEKESNSYPILLAIAVNPD